MEIKTKLSIGDPIVVIAQLTETIQKECEVCKGEKKVIIEQHTYECPECYGKGYKSNIEPQCWRVWEDDYHITPSKVKRIDVEVVKKVIEITYFPWGTSGNFFHEKDCFKTIKEAQDECDRRNVDGVK